MGKFIDLTGQRFGRLVAQRRVGQNARHQAIWLTVCDDGNETVVSASNLRRGNTKSCGKCPNKVEHRPDGTTVIFLERKNGEVSECIIDAADYPLVKDYRWREHKSHHTKYAITALQKDGKKTTRHLHKFLLPNVEHQVDHKNHLGLDNRRDNLRPATQSQNQRNKRKVKLSFSHYKGVGQSSNRFRADIRIDGTKMYLGSFDSAENAAHAYNEAAKKYFGEFAHLNQIPEAVAA